MRDDTLCWSLIPRFRAHVLPPKPLLVHCHAFSLQQEMQTPVAKAAAYLCQLPNAQPNGTIVPDAGSGSAPSTDQHLRLGTPPLAHGVRSAHVSHDLPLRDGRHHFGC
jgi:hypothetical protein